MTVLVVGRSGQVAQSLVAAGRIAAIPVVAVGRPDVDLAEPGTIEAAINLFRPAVVINAAAFTAVDRAESEPEAAFAINAAGAGSLARLCARADIALVHLSTDYVFDGSQPEAYAERDSTAPLNVYGRTKLEGEALVAARCPRHVIVRTSWVFSPYGTNFVKTMLRLAEGWPEVSIVDDQTGCPTYAPHLAQTLLAMSLRLLDPPGIPASDPLWGIYHAAGEGETTWCGFAREVFRCSTQAGGPEAAVRPISTAEFPTAAARPRNSRLDCSKLARVFGLRLPDWRAGVAACVAELKTRSRAERAASTAVVPGDPR